MEERTNLGPVTPIIIHGGINAPAVFDWEFKVLAAFVLLHIVNTAARDWFDLFGLRRLK